MISNRSKLSLCQFLLLQDINELNILLGKHGITIPHMITVDDLLEVLSSASPECLLSLIGEIVGTKNDLRFKVSPKYRYDDRWSDIEICLQLDGYRINERTLTSIEPHMKGVKPIEDDFSKELRRSGLAETKAILLRMDESADDFRRTPPDYNGCLTNARIALETLARSIATVRKSESLAEEKWGEVLVYLRKSDFISKKEEEGISGVYSFVSQGAHKPVGFSDQEMTRLGRSLIVSMCYFLVKLHNQRSLNNVGVQ